MLPLTSLPWIREAECTNLVYAMSDSNHVNDSLNKGGSPLCVLRVITPRTLFSYLAGRYCPICQLWNQNLNSHCAQIPIQVHLPEPKDSDLIKHKINDLSKQVRVTR
jgi:hypothetical protein